MLYHVYEMQRVALAPMRMAATGALSMLDLPFNPLRETPLGRISAAALDSFEHTTRAFGKPAWGLPTTRIDGADVAVHEEVALRKPWCDLLRFRRETHRPQDPTVLMVAPMSGHYATLLRGTVQAFLPDHNVYITDWRDARDMPAMGPDFNLDDYVDYVTAFIEHLGPDCHVIAVCQPAVPVLAAISLMNAEAPHAAPRSMTLIGGPIDTREGPTAVNAFAKSRNLEWFRRNVIHRVPFGNMGFMRQVYPGFLQLAGFMAMNLDRHMQAHWEMFQHLVEGDGEPLASKRAFYDEYRAVMDLPSDYYLQTIERVFQEHHLARGMFRHREQLVEPAAIARTALLTVEGERDDISGIGQTRAAHALAHHLAPEKHAHWEQPGVGHYGLFNGRRFNADIAPRIKQFITQHG
ncbi:MAG: polyhydroxyalkanoate depolymerase [Alphaproteobacteria bacterium]|nr:polyhydroxyalkanoate depolymerase [Alphaproteobacteria bacterium]